MWRRPGRLWRCVPGLALTAAVAIAAGCGAPASPGMQPPTGEISPLSSRLAALLRTRALRRAETGVAVLQLPEGRSVFTHHAQKPLRPASTLKIVTSAAALALLGPEFIFETGIYGDAEIDGSGSLPGNLYIRGEGAPDLVGEAWWLMSHRLAAMGLLRVKGDLVADTSYFDTVSRPPGWPSADVDSWYNAPISALSCNFNVVGVRVEPAALAGAPPELTLEPIASYFRVENRATTAPRQAGIDVDRNYRNGRNTLVVRGSIRLDARPAVFRRAVEGGALYALHAFREIARGEGIRIAGPSVLGSVPENARLLHQHASRPLAALVRDMNKNSNNFMAEMLVKTLGARFAGTPGTTAGGVRVMRDYLAGLGLDPSTARIVDGSGLSERNRLSAGLLAGFLARVHGDFNIGPEILVSLPIAGADGTLDERFAGNDAHRHARAKTGRVKGAVTLAGYATNRDGRRFAFAILANRPRGSVEAAQRAIDALVEVITTSTDADLLP